MALSPLMYLLMYLLVSAVVSNDLLPHNMYFRGKSHGNFLGVDPGDGARAYAANWNRAWELWEVEENGDGTYSFRSAHGTYLGVEPGHGERAYGAAVKREWERFQLIQHDDGYVSFQTYHGTFLGLEEEHGGRAYGAGWLRGHEVFQVVPGSPYWAATQALDWDMVSARRQEGGVCWAHTVATGIRATQYRQGRQETDHQQLVEEMVDNFGRKGIDRLSKPLKYMCPRYGLDFRENVSEEKAIEALKKQRVVLGSYFLTEEQWSEFHKLVHSGGIVETLPAKANNPISGGHAVAIVGLVNREGGQYWRIKNSWGPETGDKGYLWVKRNSIHFQFDDIFFNDEL